MKSATIKPFTLFFSLILFMSVSAQDLKNIDVRSLMQQDIRKAQKAMQDAGLTIDQAAEIARQRGATEQQIIDFRNRFMELTLEEELATDTLRIRRDDEEQEQLDEDEFSKRDVEFDLDNEVFGSYLFNNENLTFEPRINIQTPRNYEIGIGDEVLIHIWGNSQNDYQLKVNNNGQIMIPDVGPVFIAGLTFNLAETKIKQSLSEIYSDMSGNNPGTFAQINMGQLRSIQVNIVGEVTAPGTYTLPATATVFNGLYLSGGPNEIGSFRSIKVIRNNQLEKAIDIYKFLIDADPSENIILKDGDIVFIPPLESKVKISGEFKRNGIFELKEGETLSDLIRYSGGFTEYAYMNNTKILRQTQQGQKVYDIPYDMLSSTLLLNGDQVSNDSIIINLDNYVYIDGAVYRPGEYQWSKDLFLSGLIQKADSLTPDAFQARGLIKRHNKDLSISTISFNVQNIANRTSDVKLHPRDSVFIKSHFDLKEQPYISITGEVLDPNVFLWAENITLGDAIFLAGGLTEGADSSFIEIARRLSYNEASMLSDTLTHIIVANISRGLSIGKNDADLKLKPYDQISIRKAPNFRKGETAFITGEVAYAGPYAISNKQLRISDLVKMAGGITPQAYLSGATLERYSEELGLERVAIDLQKILDNPKSESDLYLNDGDKINIPEFMQTVKIVGNVQNPFSITFEAGKNARYYIERSGGFNSEAQKKKTYVQYPNGSTAVTKGLIFRRYPEVSPGSIVVVPSKPEKNAGDTGRWIAIASALASLSVSIATVVSLTK